MIGLRSSRKPQKKFALDKGKFKDLPPMTTLVEKQNHAKLYEFHGEVGHNIDESKGGKKGETSGKDKALVILMVQSWKRVARKRITQSFSPNSKISFPPLGEDEGTEGLMIIEAEIGGHCIHYIISPALRLEIKNQLVPVTTPLIGFSGEIILPIGKIQLLVKIANEEHSTSDWMNFMVVRSPSPHNEIIIRPGVKKLQAVPSIAHEMLKLSIEGGVITLKSSRMISLECAMVSGSEGNLLITK
nr:reverse transcriptase domain-containing protein [Tanacetum cinerariifolium]